MSLPRSTAPTHTPGRGRGRATGAVGGPSPRGRGRGKPAPSTSTTSTRPRPTAKLSEKRFDAHRPVDAFAKPHYKTNLSQAYATGSVPCRLSHGSVKHSIQWEREPEDLDYNPLLITITEGLCETEFPFVLLARAAFRDLLNAESGPIKALPLVPRLISPLRTALVHSDKGVFEAALEALSLLSEAVGPVLDEYMPTLLQPINKRVFDRILQARIMDVLQVIETNGGPTIVGIIKAKVPTYQTL